MVEKETFFFTYHILIFCLLVLLNYLFVDMCAIFENYLKYTYLFCYHWILTLIKNEVGRLLKIKLQMNIHYELSV